MPRLVPDRVSPGQPRFRPGGGRSETASVNARPSSLLLRPGRTPPAGDAEPAWRAHQLSGEWRSGRGRRAPHKERGERRGEKGRQFRDGYSRPRPPVPPVRGRGDNAAELTCRRPRSAGPCWTVPGSPSPLLARRPPPGRGAPPRSRGRRRKSVPAAEPGNLGAGKSLRRLRGAAWRGPRPWRPWSRPSGDFLGSSSARAAARATGTAGRPESARGLCAPGLRVSWLWARWGSVVGAPGLGDKAWTEPFLLFGAGGRTHKKCEGWGGADMPPTREPYPWEPSGSRGHRGPVREGVENLEGRAAALPATSWLCLTLGK